MLTKRDIRQLTEIFVTKGEFRETTQDLLDLIQAVRKELKEDMISFKDEVLHKIVKLREDVTVIVGYRDMIEGHDMRLGKLEKKVFGRKSRKSLN